MVSNTGDVWNPHERRIDDEVEIREPWPQIGEYKEGKYTVRVFAPGCAEGGGRQEKYREPWKDGVTFLALEE